MPKLPPIPHLISHFTKSDWSQAQQGLLSPLIIPSPFPWLWFRWILDRVSGNLVNPFMRVTNWMTRHLATLRESWLIPPFTRACLNFITLTCTALGRTHIVSTPFEAIAMLCFSLNSRNPLVRSSSELIVHRTGKDSRSIPYPSIVTKRESTPHREASNSFKVARILRQGL